MCFRIAKTLILVPVWKNSKLNEKNFFFKSIALTLWIWKRVKSRRNAVLIQIWPFLHAVVQSVISVCLLDYAYLFLVSVNVKYLSAKNQSINLHRLKLFLSILQSLYRTTESHRAAQKCRSLQAFYINAS